MLGKNTAAWNNQWGFYSDSSTTNAIEQPGWKPGTNRNGFMMQTGYVWPATEQDYSSMSEGNYGGSIPIGSYFVIPNSTDISTLGLETNSGRMVAQAVQDYGAYVVDAVAGCKSFYVEYTGANTVDSAFVDDLINAPN